MTQNIASKRLIYTGIFLIMRSMKDMNGHKLRIQSVRKYYDFWPESATWRLRGGEVTHRGVYKLLWKLAKDGIKLREAGETK